ncbi:MAG: exodeoxyribonuclease VII large subunit [Eubacteriales bacterium]
MSEILSISELNNVIFSTLKKEKLLQNCWVTGEISNFKHHVPSGHWYFTLKDSKAQIKGVMFKGQNAKVQFSPENGIKVMVRGSVRIYEKDGAMQFYVEEMYPSGLGALYLAFEQLKKKLMDEGLFLDDRKKPVPRFPKKIGIVTSSTGAALRDIINVARRRNPGIGLLLIPAAVQGQSAPAEIAHAINIANCMTTVDVLIVGRGGGSLEELWAFNTEIVARAIAVSEIPVISAVGHEVDYTIADFVADLRAPTPSAAAELAVPLLSDLQDGLQKYREKILLALKNQIERKRFRLLELERNDAISKPLWRVEQKRRDLEKLTKQLLTGMTGFVSDRSGILKLVSSKLDLLSPLAILGRGYSLAYDSHERVIRSIKEVEKNSEINLKVYDGKLKCRVADIFADISNE